MHYYPVTPVNKKFNRVEDLLKYGDMANFPFSRPQAISKAYNIINKTVKLLESINYWNCLAPINKTWIAFKKFFCENHQELTKTGELTLEQSGYGQANLV